MGTCLRCMGAKGCSYGLRRHILRRFHNVCLVSIDGAADLRPSYPRVWRRRHHCFREHKHYCSCKREVRHISRSIIDPFVDDLGRSRGFALSTTGLVWTLSSGVGPLLGGAISQHLTWRWLFWINLPVCLAAFILLALFFDSRPSNSPTKLRDLDWIGSVAVIGAAVMILLSLDFGGTVSPWNSAKVLGPLVGGVVLFGSFLLWEAKGAREPIVPLRLLSSWARVAPLLVCFTHGFVCVLSPMSKPYAHLAIGQRIFLVFPTYLFSSGSRRLSNTLWRPSSPNCSDTGSHWRRCWRLHSPVQPRSRDHLGRNCIDDFGLRPLHPLEHLYLVSDNRRIRSHCRTRGGPYISSPFACVSVTC